jgi:hypothetical protein
MIRAIEELLLRDWSALGLQGPCPPRLAFIQISSSWLQDSGRITFLIFKPDDSYPCLVARIVRSESFKHILLNEHANLVSIHADNPTLDGSIPTRIFCGILDGKTVRIETALEGTLLTSLIARSGGRGRQVLVTQVYEQLGAWLDKFGHPRHPPTLWPWEKLKNRFHVSISEFCEHFELDSTERDYIGWLRARIEATGQLELPIVPNHGDLAAAAILVRDNGLGIIDWEYYCPEGLPLFDHLMAVVQTGFCLSTTKTLTLLDQFKMSFAANWYSEMAAGWLRAACQRFGLPESLLSLWLTLFLIEMSNKRDWEQQAARKHGEKGWRNLFSYYVSHKDCCYLTR